VLKQFVMAGFDHGAMLEMEVLETLKYLMSYWKKIYLMRRD